MFLYTQNWLLAAAQISLYDCTDPFTTALLCTSAHQKKTLQIWIEFWAQLNFKGFANIIAKQNYALNLITDNPSYDNPTELVAYVWSYGDS